MSVADTERRVEDILRVEAARDAANDLAATLRDLRDEKLPGSSMYLVFERAIIFADLASSELSRVLDTLRIP